MGTFIHEDAKLAVKKGVNWLDDSHPDWFNNIDLSELTMSLCYNCVIGQAIGSFTDTVAEASQSDACSLESMIWAVEHGFESPRVLIGRTDQTRSDYEYGYEDLETLWTDEVKKRLG